MFGRPEKNPLSPLKALEAKIFDILENRQTESLTFIRNWKWLLETQTTKKTLANAFYELYLGTIMEKNDQDLEPYRELIKRYSISDMEFTLEEMLALLEGLNADEASKQRGKRR